MVIITGTKNIYAKEYDIHSTDLPTAVTLTVALCPVPTVLIGTQVYTPSALTVTLSTPELLLPMRASLKEKRYRCAAGLASVLQLSDTSESRSSVVFEGVIVILVPVGTSKNN